MANAHKNRAKALLRPQHNPDLFIAIPERRGGTSVQRQFFKRSQQPAFTDADTGPVQFNRQMRRDAAPPRMRETLAVKENCAEFVFQCANRLLDRRAFAET